MSKMWVKSTLGVCAAVALIITGSINSYAVGGGSALESVKAVQTMLESAEGAKALQSPAVRVAIANLLKVSPESLIGKSGKDISREVSVKLSAMGEESKAEAFARPLQLALAQAGFDIPKADRGVGIVESRDAKPEVQNDIALSAEDLGNALDLSASDGIALNRAFAKELERQARDSTEMSAEEVKLALDAASKLDAAREPVVGSQILTGCGNLNAAQLTTLADVVVSTVGRRGVGALEAASLTLQQRTRTETPKEDACVLAGQSCELLGPQVKAGCAVAFGG